MKIKNQDGETLYDASAVTLREAVTEAARDDADLSCADLRGACLRGAHLSCADLRNACLRGADLRGACLRGADLSCANLRGADLSCANLRGADLSCANLRGADLSCADLSCADLRRADLNGADLRGTCLDPIAVPTGATRKLNWERHTTRSGQVWVRGWRTQRSTHVGSYEYVNGELYEAPYFSVASIACHPGLYLWPTREQAVSWGRVNGTDEICSVWTLAHEIHEAGSKARCRWFIVEEEMRHDREDR